MIATLFFWQITETIFLTYPTIRKSWSDEIPRGGGWGDGGGFTPVSPRSISAVCRVLCTVYGRSALKSSKAHKMEKTQLVNVLKLSILYSIFIKRNNNYNCFQIQWNSRNFTLDNRTHGVTSPWITEHIA